jgi:diguanylate cyclase (GGDEF)-like protein
MKLFLTLCLIFILSSAIFSYSIIDSLEIKLQKASGIEKIEILNSLSEHYRENSPEKSIGYGNQALEISKKINNKKLQADALNNIASGYYFLSEYDEALKYYQKSLSINEEIKNFVGVAKVLNNLGLVHRRINNLDKALEYYLQSLKIEEEIENEKGISMSLCNIGNFYYDTDDYSKALEYYLQALAIYEKIRDDKGIATILNNIGIVYDESKDYYIALEYYLKSLDIEEELGNKNGIATTSNNIGLVYYNLGIPDKALEYLFKSLRITEEIGEKYGIANTCINIGKLYAVIDNFDNSILYLNKGLQLSNEIGAIDLKIDAYSLLSDVYSDNKNYKKALEYNTLYSNEKEKIYDRENQKIFTKIESRFETDKKDQEINNLKKTSYLYIIYFLIFILIIIVSIIIFTKYRFREKIIKEMQIVNEQLKQIARTDPLTRLSNRRGILEKIEYEKHRFERSGRPFVLIMSDIDDFKSVNDQHGHECGDYVLKSLSHLMISFLRKQDVVGRWGGEEFLFLLPETTLIGGKGLAEKLRKKIANNQFYFKGSVVNITMSFGVSLYNVKDADTDDYIRKADQALYKGKKQGRNRVVMPE